MTESTRGGAVPSGAGQRSGIPWRRVAPILAGALVFVLLLWGVLAYLARGAVERVTREPGDVTFDYLSGIHFRDAERVDRETCENGGQARELARTVWNELDAVPGDVGGNEHTSALFEYLTGDAKRAGEDRVRVPVTARLVILNVPGDLPGSDVDYEQRTAWTVTLERDRWSWCVARVDRDRPFA